MTADLIKLFLSGCDKNTRRDQISGPWKSSYT